MREIKFRAFDKVKKEMHYSGFTIIGYCGEIEYPSRLRARQLNGKLDLMQYTGLKDKNGKEIYEGDILFTENGNFTDKMGTHTHSHKNEYQPVEWSDENASYYNLPHQVWMCHTEIIGNIYENPELLEVNTEL